MSTIRVASEKLIDAPAAQVYALLADYRDHHPHFLPPAFSNFRVEEGGVGEGTLISFRLTTGGRSRDYRMRVWEPNPGHTLAENDLNSSLVTTYTVDSQGAQSRVRIETSWEGAGGIGGIFERIFAPRALRRLYADELNRLDEYARNHAGAIL